MVAESLASSGFKKDWRNPEAAAEAIPKDPASVAPAVVPQTDVGSLPPP